MKVALRTLYIVLLAMSGLMFMRVILELADVSDTRAWAHFVFSITNMVNTPVSFLLYGEAQPAFTLFGTHNALEPSVVITLFGTLVSSFIVTCIAHSLERKEDVVTIGEPARAKKSFWEKD